LTKAPNTYHDEVLDHMNSCSKKLDLEWANCTQAAPMRRGNSAAHAEVSPSHIDSTTQKLIVKELYPRLMYTFSDVVCFITNNPKYETSPFGSCPSC
jgi:hypothetical protein